MPESSQGTAARCEVCGHERCIMGLGIWPSNSAEWREAAEHWRLGFDRLKAENASLRAEVREWLCRACSTIYPGPPQPGFACVMCPKCEGLTGPRLGMENASLRESLRAAEKDYADMRRFQSLYINADHARLAAEQRAEAAEKALIELLRLYDWRFVLAEREKRTFTASLKFMDETRRLLRQYGEEKKAAWGAARAALHDEERSAPPEGDK